MPTENQISAPRALLKQLQLIASGQLGHINAGFCPDHLEGHDKRDEDCPACKALSALDSLLARPAEQHQGEPVHMVRTHGCECWEEMTGESLELCQDQPEEYEVRTLYTRPAPAVQKGEPAMWANAIGDTISSTIKVHNITLGGAPAKLAKHYVYPLYAHADAGEVERLRADLATVKSDRDAYAQNAIDLRTKLAACRAELLDIRQSYALTKKRDAQISAVLSASAEPEAKS